MVVKSLLPISRPARNPQIHRFRLHEDAEVEAVEAVRGSVEEQPRAAALLAPVQNILPEPVPAVPGAFPASRANNFQTFAHLQPVPAVPNAAVLPASLEADTRVRTTNNGGSSRAMALLRGRQRIQTPAATPSVSSSASQPSPTLAQRRPSAVPSFSATGGRQASRASLGRDGPRDEPPTAGQQPRTTADVFTTPFGRDKEVLVPTLARDEGRTTPLGREATTLRDTTATTAPPSRDTTRAKTMTRLRGLFAARGGTTPATPRARASSRRPLDTRVTTRRPLDTLTKVLETSRRGDFIQHPELG